MIENVSDIVILTRVLRHCGMVRWIRFFHRKWEGEIKKKGKIKEDKWKENSKGTTTNEHRTKNDYLWLFVNISNYSLFFSLVEPPLSLDVISAPPCLINVILDVQAFLVAPLLAPEFAWVRAKVGINSWEIRITITLNVENKQQKLISYFMQHNHSLFSHNVNLLVSVNNQTQINTPKKENTVQKKHPILRSNERQVNSCSRYP